MLSQNVSALSEYKELYKRWRDSLNVNGSVIKDQKQVAEVLLEHFATLADGIGGDAAECKASAK